MDNFIFIGDFIKQIQSDNLSQIIGGNQMVLDGIQASAIDECVSFLSQKYDTSKAFRAITGWDRSKSYKAGQTIYLNATAYDKTKTYALNALVINSSNCYQCISAINTPEDFNPSHWTLLGAQYATFYALAPKAQFNYLLLYSRGDQVFYKDKVYTCLVGSQILDHASQLEIGQPVESRVLNVFPDDSNKGAQSWGIGVDYSVPANTEITNTAYWTLGDARDQKLLQICIDIALYHAHSRIAPRNIPELRITRYVGSPDDRTFKNGVIYYPVYSALGWLQSAAKGEIAPNLPLIQPSQGKRIRFGSNIKLINNY